MFFLTVKSEEESGKTAKRKNGPPSARKRPKSTKINSKRLFKLLIRLNRLKRVLRGNSNPLNRKNWKSKLKSKNKRERLKNRKLLKECSKSRPVRTKRSRSMTLK